jgi:oligopeptide/dipeptide ABC transporter ATP-binding protein
MPTSSNADAPLVELRDVEKHFPIRQSFMDWLRRKPRRSVRALDGVSFTVPKGKVLGLVGESGCGKSTTGLILSLLETPTAGQYRFDGVDPLTLRGAALKHFRRRTQVIFQDPYQTLNPRLTIVRTLVEPLNIHKRGADDKERRRMAGAALRQVGLPESYLDKFPHELSGGQRQRVAIARAVILNPDLIVADEPISMLDVSIRSSILNLMLRLKAELEATFVFITHDLASARYICDEIAVMYLGRVVEQGPADEVIQHPGHPYTQLLLASVPDPRPGQERPAVAAPSEPPNPANVPPGCPFHPRCPSDMDICRQGQVARHDVSSGHWAACHLLDTPSTSRSTEPASK